jgi:hypothetical protein
MSETKTDTELITQILADHTEILSSQAVVLADHTDSLEIALEIVKMQEETIEFQGAIQRVMIAAIEDLQDRVVKLENK